MNADTNADKNTSTDADAEHRRDPDQQRRHVLSQLPAKAGYGKNDQQRHAYLLAQQALRRFATRGYTLETDRDGVAQMRVPKHASSAPTTLDAMASAWPARRVTDTAELGKSVRGWRERLGISRTTACEGASVSASFLRSVEGGKQSVQFGRLLDVLDILGLELVVRVRRDPSADQPVVQPERLAAAREATQAWRLANQ